MAKREMPLSVSAFLLRLGDALRFSPEEGVAVPERKTRAFRLIPGEKLLRVKNLLARMREQSLFLSLYSAFIRGLLLTRIRSFAPLLFISGLIQTVSYFVGDYFPILSGGQHNLVMGLVFIILGLICAFDRSGLSAVLKKSLLFRDVLHPLLGIEAREIPDGRLREHLWWMLLSGAVLGVLSVAFSPFIILSAVLSFFTAALVLYKPEAGLIVAALLFPFIPRWAFSVLLVLLHLSLMMKITVGKRSLVRSPADLPILILMAYLAIRGGAQGISYALILSAYFLGLHLMRTAAWIRRVTAALSLAAGVSAAASFSLFLIERFAPDVLHLFPDLAGFLTALVGREQEALAVLILPLAVCLSTGGWNVSARFFSVVAEALCFLSLIIARSPGLWLAAVIGLILVLVLSRRWGLLATVFTALTGYTVFMLLPGTARGAVAGFLGLEETRLAQLSAALVRGRLALSRSLPWGVGRESAKMISGGETVYHLAGIFGGWVVLSAFAAAAVWFFVRCVRFSSGCAAGHTHPVVLGAMAGVLVWLICGVTAPMTAPEPLFVLALFLAFPKAAESAACREEVRQPY